MQHLYNRLKDKRGLKPSSLKLASECSECLGCHRTAGSSLIIDDVTSMLPQISCVNTGGGVLDWESWASIKESACLTRDISPRCVRKNKEIHSVFFSFQGYYGIRIFKCLSLLSKMESRPSIHLSTYHLSISPSFCLSIKTFIHQSLFYHFCTHLTNFQSSHGCWCFLWLLIFQQFFQNVVIKVKEKNCKPYFFSKAWSNKKR